MNRPEQALQIAVAKLLDTILPPEVFWFHVPNGGARTKAEGAILKAMGVKPGVPDICLNYQGRAYYVELKAPGRYASKSQRETISRLLHCGVRVFRATSIDEILEILASAKIPHKAVSL